MEGAPTHYNNNAPTKLKPEASRDNSLQLEFHRGQYDISTIDCFVVWMIHIK